MLKDEQKRLKWDFQKSTYTVDFISRLVVPGVSDSAEELGDLGKEGREERPHRAREGPTGSTYRNVDCV